MRQNKITIAFSEEEWEKIFSLAKSEGIRVSALIRKAALEKYQREFCTKTAKELSEYTGMAESRIRQLAPKMEKDGLAFPPSPWKFSSKAVHWLRDRPETRGRKKQ